MRREWDFFEGKLMYVQTLVSSDDETDTSEDY